MEIKKISTSQYSTLCKNNDFVEDFMSKHVTWYSLYEKNKFVGLAGLQIYIAKAVLKGPFFVKPTKTRLLKALTLINKQTSKNIEAFVIDNEIATYKKCNYIVMNKLVDGRNRLCTDGIQT